MLMTSLLIPLIMSFDTYVRNLEIEIHLFAPFNINRVYLKVNFMVFSILAYLFREFFFAHGINPLTNTNKIFN